MCGADCGVETGILLRMLAVVAARAAALGKSGGRLIQHVNRNDCFSEKI